MLNLLVLLPVTLLFLAALGIVILQQLRPSIGYAWLIAALAGLAASIALIVLRWRVPLHISMNAWRSFGDLSSPPSFRLDLSSWPYAFSLAVLALAFILTDAARLETEARPYNWAIGLALAGLGMLAVMAGNPITLILVWTGVDLAEFILFFSTGASRSYGLQTVTLFSVRVAGTLVVIFAVLLSRAQSIPFDLAPIPAGLAVIMLVAAGLRLGVLPLNIPYTREVYTWRGLGTVMRMVGPASSLAVLGFMPEQAVPAEWKFIFLFFSALAAIYGAAMWWASDNEISGRTFWVTALAALAVGSVVNGNPRASIAWGMVLIFSGSVLFFYSARRQQILFIPLLAVLGIAGLPFNPAAPGWLGIAAGQSSFYTVLFLVSVLFLIWGSLRHIFLRKREELYRMERWVHTVYPGGLLFLVLAQWVVGLFGWPGSRTLGVWWASALVTFLVALGAALSFTYWRRDGARGPSAVPAPVGEPAVAETGDPGLAAPALAPFAQDALARPQTTAKAAAAFDIASATRRWVFAFAGRIGGALDSIFRLNWLYQLIAWLYRFVQGLVLLLTAMFEGDGGILWSLVILALLISIILVGVNR